MMVRRFLARVRYLIQRRRQAADLAEELQLHLDLRAHRNLDRGMTPDTARREALRSFGNVARLQEDAREVWLALWLEQFMQDLKFGMRGLLRSPGFTAVVVLTLAIGIGVNTTMFSIVNAVLLQPLPYPSPDRLVWIANADPRCNPDCFVSRADVNIWAHDAPSFESMAAYGNVDLSLVGDSGSTAERIAFVSDGFWNLSGAKPAFGRLPGPGEIDKLVLSWSLFERQFRGDPNVVGKIVKMEGHRFQIAGVLAKEFRFFFPQQLYTGDELRDIDGYAPIPIGTETPGEPIKPHERVGPGPGWVRVVGKLKPQATVEQGRAELFVIHDRLNRQYPSPFRKKTLSVMPLAERIVGEARLALLVLLGAVGFVLVIACANVANLLLARASVRRKEIAIRAALGAGKARVFRQFVTESILLAFLGGIAGLALAKGALLVAIHLSAHAVPRVADTTIDTRVLLFTLLITLITGTLFGLAPSVTLWRKNLDEVLREDAKAASFSSGQQKLRAVLVGGEITLAVILLTGAGLMLRSFWKMNTYPPGFTPERVLVMKISLAGGRYYRNWPVQDTYIRELLQRVEGIPGVEAAGIDCGATNQPVDVGSPQGTAVRDKPVVALRAVSRGYLRALGATLTRGTWPSAADAFDVVLVNQSLAWRVSGPGKDLVGKPISGSFLRATIGGVVSDFKDRQLDSQPAPQVYMPYQKSPTIGSVRLIIRTAGDPESLQSVIRERVESIDSDVPIQRFQTLRQELFDSLAPRRFNLYLLAAFAATALLLAMVGIYGMITYVVTQRTREIGIRMALGARRHDIVGMVARHAMRIAILGLVTGVMASLLLTRIMASMIYDVNTTDPLTFIAVGITLGLTALLACCRPAYRAAVMDPLLALRHD
jgi:predicted permease